MGEYYRANISEKRPIFVIDIQLTKNLIYLLQVQKHTEVSAGSSLLFPCFTRLNAVAGRRKAPTFFDLHAHHKTAIFLD